MITMSELVDLRLQQHIAQEIYRQQIMQRIPDPFHHMLPMSHHVIMPPRKNLPGVTAQLENNELWQQFHQIGTEMIITKTGRRIFPSMRLSLSGLEDESNYCVLLEMVPIGDCRYKFSGSQWVPAGGAEPQSPQRMYLHPDSPATGAHWQSQPLLFNKVKLTNNTLDNNGHMVLASMHKYQPRLHVIRASDLTQLPWAPQQAFVFPETEFVAVTAYQNDRITKLKIDNNPFAKGFRESGQSRCKRKLSTSPSLDDQTRDQQQQQRNNNDSIQSTNPLTDDDRSSLNSYTDTPLIKRIRSNDSACSLSTSPFDEGSLRSFENISPPKIISDIQQAAPNLYLRSMAEGNSLLGRAALADLAYMYFPRPQPVYPAADYRAAFQPYDLPAHLPLEQQCLLEKHTAAFEANSSRTATPCHSLPQCVDTFVDVESTSCSDATSMDEQQMQSTAEELPFVATKQHSFSISAILGNKNVFSV